MPMPVKTLLEERFAELSDAQVHVVYEEVHLIRQEFVQREYARTAATTAGAAAGAAKPAAP